MTDLITWVAGVAGGGGVLTLFAAGLLWLTKTSIARAVEQAGAREIVNLKGQLDKELAEKRNALNQESDRLKGELAKELQREQQTFTRELDRSRADFAKERDRIGQDAAKTLEGFKAQLTFESEVRRQAAAKKVEILIKLAAVTNLSVSAVYSEIDPTDLQKRTAVLSDYWRVFREALVLLESQTLKAAEALGREMGRANGAMWAATKNGTQADIDELNIRSEESRDRLFELVRQELQLATVRASET